MNRRQVLQTLTATALAAPAVFRQHATAAPSDTVYHASFGADGMAYADLSSLAGSKNLKLVAVAEVDTNRLAKVKKQFPDVKVYADWRELLDKEKNLTSCNISTPDHMHAPITMRAMHQGLHVYTQKPLTQTIYEARRLREVATEKKLVTQMGIQIHSHAVHRTVVATIQAGAIGKVKEVHSWSGKQWGDAAPKPDKKDPVPANLNWDLWLGVAAERPFIGGSYYHPGNWRKRLDFGTGTFGDMGCHILDPVFASTAVTNPTSVVSTGDAPNEYNWGLNVQVKYTFAGSQYTTDTVVINWYNGKNRPPAEVVQLLGKRTLNDQGSIYIGTEGVLYSPYIGAPILLPTEKFAEYKIPNQDGQNHYLQFVEAVRGNGKTSAPFEYSGPLTEAVLLGCLSTRFKGETLEWVSDKLQIKNNAKATAMVKRDYRKGWEVEGL
ncbi:MAG: Gfo/Idh/MocA family oxidoreductase [Zavarzinella sp.]